MTEIVTKALTENKTTSMTESTVKSQSKSLLLALFLGCLFPLGFAPFNYWWLSMISVGCFPLILGDSKSFLRGWAYGTGVFTVGVGWVFVSLYNYTGAGILGASVVTALLGISLGLFFAFLGYIHQQIPSQYRHPMLSVGLWIGLEWVRSWLFTGFPWLYLGYTALESPLFNHWIPILGVYGCSALMGLWSMLVINLIHQYWKTRTFQDMNWATVLFLLLLPVSNFMLGQINWTENSNETLQVALIQGNIEQTDKWDPIKAPIIASHYLNMTELAASDGAELIIWPEAALPYLYSQGQKTLEDARAILNLAPLKPLLITGLLTDNQDSQRPDLREVPPLGNELPDVRNSILSLSQDLAGDHFYHKQRLVPFGEYLPFAEQLVRIMPFLTAFQHGITPGQENQDPIQAKGWSIQPLICYEIAFPGLAFSQINQSAEPGSVALVDAILTISNDGWFGLSHGPSQHFQMAQFRAKEFGRPVIRATNTGITGFINAQGKVITILPRQQPGILFYELNKTKGATPYATYGPTGVLYGILAITLMSLTLILMRSGVIKPEKQ